MIDPDLARLGLDITDRLHAGRVAGDDRLLAQDTNFPYLDVSSRGRNAVWPDAESVDCHLDGPGAGLGAPGWVQRRVIDTNAARIVVAGEYDASEDGDTRQATCIITCVAGKWGLQSRFIVDSSQGESLNEFERRAFKVVDAFLGSYNNANRDSCLELLNFPFYAVQPGVIRELTNPGDATLTVSGELQFASLTALQTGLTSLNIVLEMERTAEDGTRSRYNAVVLMTDEDGHLGFKAWSVVTPD